MDVRIIAPADHALLESAGGYLKQYGQNVRRWIEKGFVVPQDCYVFDAGGTVAGGVCFFDDTQTERTILDFALADSQMPHGAQALKKAVHLAARPQTKSIGYNLYDDTEQYADIRNLFTRAGFRIAQAKKNYTYERPEPPQRFNALTFRSIAEAGEEVFINAVEEVTVGTLDQRMADDAARLGGGGAAREYVAGMQELDFHADWWQLGYCGGELVGLVLPQKFDDTVGGLNYIGVLPQHLGHGYGAMLIAQGTHTLHASRMRKIIADIDEANHPMAAALERVEYLFRMDESFLLWERGTSGA